MPPIYPAPEARARTGGPAGGDGGTGPFGRSMRNNKRHVAFRASQGLAASAGDAGVSHRASGRNFVRNVRDVFRFAPHSPPPAGVRVCVASVPPSTVSLMHQTGLDGAAHGKCPRLADGAHAGLAPSHREDDEGSRPPAQVAGLMYWRTIGGKDLSGRSPASLERPLLYHILYYCTICHFAEFIGEGERNIAPKQAFLPLRFRAGRPGRHSPMTLTRTRLGRRPSNSP